MQDRQRTVVVVASGLALAVLAMTLNRLLTSDDGGWTAYAPNTAASFSPESIESDTEIWREAAVWLGAIAIWAGLALWLYRRPPST